MTLRTRLALSLAAIALLLALPLAAAFRAMRRAEREATTLRDQDVAGSLVVARIRETTDRLRVDDESVVLVGNRGDGVENTKSDLRTLRTLVDSIHTFDLKPLSRDLNALLAVYDARGPGEWAAALAGNGDAAEDISGRYIIPALTAAASSISNAEGDLAARAEERATRVRDAATTAWLQAGALFIAAAAGALAIGIWLTRSISRPVFDLERGMAAVASGRFDHKLDVAPGRSDEFGRLAQSYQQMATQLAELDKLKAEFVSIASHELKTPINVILGYATLLLEELYGPVSDGQRRVLLTLERQGQSLARLVQHLLDVSRFQSGAAQLDVRPFALRPFLADVESAHGVLAAQRGLTLTVRTAADTPDVVTWDADRMREVLDNLLSNAVKFTNSGGTVDLLVAPRSLDGAAAVAIDVRDSGVGIPSEQVARIFQKFFQADNQSGASAKGTGLGLAISKEIIDAHGGSIGVDSLLGHGTRFSLVMPVVARDAVATDASAVEPSVARVPGAGRPVSRA